MRMRGSVLLILLLPFAFCLLPLALLTLRGHPGFLLVCERDVHLLEGRGVERPRDLEPFGLLILLEAVARRRVELARRVARVEAALFENLLRLLDLLLRGAEDGAALPGGVGV